MKIAIFGRSIGKEGIGELTTFVTALSKYKELEVSIYHPFYLSITELIKENNINPTPFEFLSLASFFDSDRELSADTDLFFSLGGDGTLLSSVPFVREKNIPVVGVNFGRLGFLTSSKLEANEESDKWFKNLLDGAFSIQKRPLLTITGDEIPEDFYPFALNEFALQREGPAVLELDIKVNGSQVPKYVADGVLVATATGSTAYSLSAGGPILLPECDVITLVPLAPHNLNIRPLVLPSDSQVEISFTTRYDCATLTADNRSFKLTNGATVRICKSSTKLNLVSPEVDFMRGLSQKLFWGADWRNL